MSRTERGVRWRILLIAGLAAATAATAAIFWAGRARDEPASPAPPPAADGEPSLGFVADFALLDQQGRFHQLSRYADRRAVVIFVHGVGCPIVAKSTATLAALRESLSARSIELLLLNANPQDEREAIRADVERLGLDVPVLVDESQLVAEQLELTRTAEALLIDTRTWKIVYRGPVDDRLHYEAERPAAREHWLADAIDALLAGREVAVPWRPAVGCLINLDRPGRPRDDVS